MSLPLVSVIIPVYNAELYIAQTIQSVIDQTWQAKEILVIDDGSTDGSYNIIKHFECDNLKIFKQANKGASAARNLGIKEAKGQYIQFLDSDDLLSPDKIEQQVAMLLANTNTVAVCSTIHFKSDQDLKSARPSEYEEAFLIDTVPVNFLMNLYGAHGESGSMVQPNAWLTPKSIIERAGPWNENLTVDDDGEYFCRVLLSSAGVRKSGGFNYYRKHAGNGNLSSAKQGQHLISQFKSVKSKIAYLKKHTTSQKVQKIYARWLYDIKFKAYPAYPDLVQEAENEIDSLSLSYPAKYPFATTTGKTFCLLFGWKIAKRIQMLKQSFIH